MCYAQSGKAKLCQTAGIFDAQEARRIGLLHEVVASDKPDERIGRILKQMKSASKGAGEYRRGPDDIGGRAIDDELCRKARDRLLTFAPVPKQERGLSRQGGR
jgi:enoyl-CoA hydratase/carnithine racemase